MSYLVVKNPLQNSSIKIQGSISHTPEGTNPVRERLTEGAEGAIGEGTGCTQA
jgi:hypothetical protein